MVHYTSRCIFQLFHKRTHMPIRKKHRTRTFLQQHKMPRPRGAGGPDEAPGCEARHGARRLWLSLSGARCCAGMRMRTPRFPAIPAASEMVFIGNTTATSDERYDHSRDRGGEHEHHRLHRHLQVGLKQRAARSLPLRASRLSRSRPRTCCSSVR